MRKVGTIDIAFKTYADGVYYYDVQVTIGNETRTIVLPRYHTFLGWIEVFGLPPQNEWVVLDTFEEFRQTGTLEVDGTAYEETVHYTPQEASHRIETIRRNDTTTERCLWTQNYAGAPKQIVSEVLFEHAAGHYQAKWDTAVLENVHELPTKDEPFATATVQANGTPDVIITKSVTAAGQLPPVYYSLFPVHELLNLNSTSGTVVELGYLHTDSPYRIDHVHGAWHKQFRFADTVLHVVESNYSSCDLNTEHGLERIKDTYRKELYVQS